MIRRTPQARITNQGVNPVGEGKAALAAGAAVTHAAILYRNAAKAARKRGAVPLKDEVARARAGNQPLTLAGETLKRRSGSGLP